MPHVERPNLKIESTDAGVVAHLIGCTALNEQTTPAIQTQLVELAQEVGGGTLILDLGCIIHYASSIGLAMLIGVHHKLNDAGGHLAVREVNPEVFEILEVTGLTRFLDIQRKAA